MDEALLVLRRALHSLRRAPHLVGVPHVRAQHDPQAAAHARPDGTLASPGPRTHTLALIDPWYTDMLEGRKMFEVRRERPGRRFEEGDVILFHHATNPLASFQRVVTYVLRDMSWYGIDDDVAVLGLTQDVPGLYA